jgi:hypothetical protein
MELTSEPPLQRKAEDRAATVRAISTAAASTAIIMTARPIFPA